MGLSPIQHFQCCSFSRSDTSPGLLAASSAGILAGRASDFYGGARGIPARIHLGRLRRWGLGTLGSVGVTGIARGGDVGGRLAACFANASATYSFEAAGGWAVVVACLNGRARMIHLPAPTDGVKSLVIILTRVPAARGGPA